MDLEKWMAVVTKYASDYFSAFVGGMATATLQHPPLRRDKNVAVMIIAAPTNSDERRLEVAPRAWLFAATSAALGAFVLRFSGAIDSKAAFLGSALIPVLLWLLISAVAHVAYRLTGGTGHHAYTVSIVLQVFGIVFVMSAALSLVFRAIGVDDWVAALSSSGFAGRWAFLFASPAGTYFAIQWPLLSVYLPLTLARTHRAPRLLLVALALPLPALVLQFNSQFSDRFRLVFAPPPAPSPSPSPAERPLRLELLEFGRALRADNRVVQPVTDFQPSDTFYLSLVTSGGGPNTRVVTRWSYQTGELVSESSSIAATPPGGEAVTEFHLVKATPWPPGRYSVVVLVEERELATASFTVTAR